MGKEVKQRKQDLIRHIKASVLTMGMQPGQDLDEHALSATFGLSRTPLREVFRQLAGEGFLIIRENRGARVSDLNHDTLRNFFLTAPMIYGAILRLAAKNALPHQIAELKGAQAKFSTALKKGSSADRAMANNRFHEITGEMANNVYLTPTFHRLLIDHARIGMTFYRPQNSDMADKLSEASRHHEEMIQAIERRDEVAAAQLATDHWQLSKNSIELYVMPDALDFSIESAASFQSA